MKKHNPNVISRAQAAEQAGPRQVRLFQLQTLMHYQQTVRGMGHIVRSMRYASPEALVLLAGLYERLIADLQPCSCTVSKRSGSVLGEDDCAVHGFGN